MGKEHEQEKSGRSSGEGGEIDSKLPTTNPLTPSLVVRLGVLELAARGKF